MKNLILIFISVLLVGCESTGPQVTTDDEKSQAILSAYDGYLANEYSWAEELYSDDITVYINSVEAIDKEANVAGLAAHHDLFSDISISSPGGEGGAYVQTKVGDSQSIFSSWKGRHHQSPRTPKFRTYVCSTYRSI